MPGWRRLKRDPPNGGLVVPTTLETIGDRVPKRRLELGLTREEAADGIGVHFTTITELELRGRTLAARSVNGVEFLGYVPPWYEQVEELQNDTRS